MATHGNCFGALRVRGSRNDYLRLSDGKLRLSDGKSHGSAREGGQLFRDRRHVRPTDRGRHIAPNKKTLAVAHAYGADLGRLAITSANLHDTRRCSDMASKNDAARRQTRRAKSAVVYDAAEPNLHLG
jgi:hypothetical protein